MKQGFFIIKIHLDIIPLTFNQKNIFYRNEIALFPIFDNDFFVYTDFFRFNRLFLGILLLDLADGVF